jgi:hypothetical protein
MAVQSLAEAIRKYRESFALALELIQAVTSGILLLLHALRRVAQAIALARFITLGVADTVGFDRGIQNRCGYLGHLSRRWLASTYDPTSGSLEKRVMR